jgi:UDP-glucose 4-epimerase
MKIFVTGAGGMIGTYTTQALYREGYEIVALYRKASAQKNAHPWKIIEADLLSDRGISELETIHPDVVVHCAAVLPEQLEGEEANKTAEINRKIDNGVLKFCQNHDCSLIYTSSTSVYGSTGFPWNEESPVSPWGPYGIAKFETEQQIKTMKNRHVILRISAPYAPEQPSRTVLKIFIERALEDLDLLYYGNGERQQDFTASEDVARAIVRSVSNSTACGVFNIASGQPVSMIQLAELVIKCASETKSKAVAAGTPDPQEEYRAYFDISKAKSILGWIPSFSLEYGIRRWMQSLEKNR